MLLTNETARVSFPVTFVPDKRKSGKVGFQFFGWLLHFNSSDLGGQTSE